MSDLEDRRREAPDGPEDDMRQDVHVEQLIIPWTTKLSLGGLLAVVAGLVTWNLITTLAIQESQANDKRELWIEIGKLQAMDAVVDVRLRSLESRAERQEK
ncbi:MAG TPA: hypothetical protein VEC57_20950 [Candidatus Limnocylindrales bacterium]|nr:hypothetical protein [Candidatus Limnocylindrales bacterium]